MMKKLFFLICIISLAITALASCGQECEHPVSEDWTSDAGYHWHATTCEHGEFRQGYAAHADADEDGKCDVCAYEVGHEHTFKSEWTSDEDKHWKDATCSHTSEKAEESLHIDDDQNGECDACAAHVHILDGAGFCSGCNKEIIPVDEYDIGSVISASTARTHNIVSGKLNDYAISRWNDESKNLELEQTVEFWIGTNGTYRKWTYDEVDDDGNKTGKTEILEQWLEIVNGGEVEGIDAKSVDGVYKFAQPGTFSQSDLMGYYYTVSTLADGYGASELLFNLYNAYLDYHTEDAVIVHDDENNKYDFSFKALVVHEVNIVIGDIGLAYNVNYYEVSLSFTYADDYTLTSLDVTCNAWTNDAGNGDPIDFTYTPENGLEWKDDAIADSYVLSVTQTVGTRGEVELNDGSEFTPTSFELYADEACTTVAPGTLNIDVSETLTRLYVTVSPEGKFISFLKNDFISTVTDKDGNPVTGLMAVLVGDTVQILPAKGGEYVVTLSALGVTKIINVNVTAPEVKGANKLTLEVLDSYSWSNDWSTEEYPDGICYEFVATAFGEYTFYLPANFGMWVKNESEPTVDPFYPYYNTSEEHSVTVTLLPNQVYRFYFGARAVGVYEIGYDYVAP